MHHDARLISTVVVRLVVTPANVAAYTRSPRTTCRICYFVSDTHLTTWCITLTLTYMYMYRLGLRLITSIGKPVAKLWPFLYIQDGRQPPSWILSSRKYRHSIHRPRTKTLAYNRTWSGSDAPFARYSPLNYTVTLKLGFGVT